MSTAHLRWDPSLSALVCCNSGWLAKECDCADCAENHRRRAADRTGELIDERERRNARVLFGEDGMQGASAPVASPAPNVLEVTVRCPTPNCGLDGRATVSSEPFRISLDMRCPCESANDPAWVAELRRQAVHEWARIRREAARAAEPESPKRPARSIRDTYSRGAGRYRRSY